MTTVAERIKAAVVGLRTGRSLTSSEYKMARRAGAGNVQLWPDYRNKQPLWSLTDIQSFIDYGFNINSVIYAACMYRADAVNTAYLRAYSGTPADPVLLPPTDPLSKLLQRPNSFQSSHEFHALNSVFFAIAGQSFVWFKRSSANETPEEMFTLRPDWVKIVPYADDSGPGVDYVYWPAGSQSKATAMFAEDVMHIKRPNPGDPLMGAGYGFSPLGPAAQSANVDNDVTRFLKIFFQSGAMFQNAISFEGQHDPNALAEVREKLKNTYGGVDNWNEWGVFDSSAKITRVSPTFEEMGFGEIDSRSEARILMALGVAPSLIGSRYGLERSTFSNYEEARRSFWEDRLLPELRMFESEAQHFLNNGTKFVQYDLSDVPALQRNAPELATAAKTLMDMGVPPRIAFDTVGLNVAAYEGDMERYVNVGGGTFMTPVDVAPTADEATEIEEGTAPEDVEAGEKARQTKAYDAAAMQRKVDTLATDWEARFGDEANVQFANELRTISAMLNETQKAAYRQKATPNWTVLMKTIVEWYEEVQPEVWREAFVPLINGTMGEAGAEWAATLGVTWDVRNLAGEAWFQDYMLQFASPITENSSEMVQAVLAQAQAEGWSIPQTEKRLGEVFEQWMQGDLSAEDFEWFEERMPAYRRESLARTETIRAANAGTLNLGKSWGASRKFWIGTFDDRTRDDHIIARDKYTEEGAISIDKPFIVGGNEMNAPGDPSAPAEQVVQCRCALGLLMD